MPHSATPQTGTPQTVTPQTGTPQAVTPQAVTPQALSVQTAPAQTPTVQAVDPQTVTSQAVTSQTAAPPTATPQTVTAPHVAPLADARASGVRLVRDLVAHVPSFQGAYDSHVFRQGDVLPHVFFWDVVQGTVRSYLAEGEAADWRRILDLLEERCGRGDAAVDEVIVTSFLGDLPSPHEPGHGIVLQLGPVLAARFGRMRPRG
ncbi:hypothetical protein ACFZCF_08375 [Streptomyces sp. NPDC007945]|uniref:DUF7674 family protein n=1 Tax=Streptomyces sp. NPDC007945 TaxID=3364797 RepID=UPI0036ECC6AC